MVWVRPGVLLKKASFLRLARALIALDLPTFERPAKASSGPASGGKSAGFAAELTKRAWRKADKGAMVCPNGEGPCFPSGTEFLIKSRLSTALLRGLPHDSTVGV